MYVLAGCNGAGKSSVGGAAFRATGSDYFNPDEAARRIAVVNAHSSHPPSQEAVNGAAWAQGKRLLDRAIAQRADFAFETTLGGETMTASLIEACHRGIAVHIWFAGLASVDLHIERIRRRVAKGGHDIPVAKVRERYKKSRLNLVRLLPHLASLRLYDNSADADPATGAHPQPVLLLHLDGGRIVEPSHLAALLSNMPTWARPIAAVALKLHLRAGR